jgi:PleD family two-component response regulator
MTEMNNAVSPASARVLIVDDEETQRNGLASMVTSWGFAAETASDGQDALDKVNNGSGSSSGDGLDDAAHGRL